MSEANREKMTGYAQASLKTGLVGSRKVSLVFTERRVLVASITKELEKEEMKKTKEAASTEGKGLLGQMAAMTLLLGRSFERRYSAMTCGEVLGENGENFDIPFDSIDRAVLNVDKVKDFQGLDSDEEYRLEVRSQGTKHKFRIKGYFGTVKAFMEANLGERFILSR